MLCKNIFFQILNGRRESFIIRDQAPFQKLDSSRVYRPDLVCRQTMWLMYDTA